MILFAQRSVARFTLPSGGFTVTSSRARPTVLDESLDNFALLLTEMSAPDYLVSADFQVLSALDNRANFGVFARYDSETATYLWGIYNVATSRCELYRRTFGQAPVALGVSQPFPLPASLPATLNLKLKCEGETITLLANDVEKVTAADAVLGVAGRVGFNVYYVPLVAGSGVHVDNLAVDSLTGDSTEDDSTEEGSIGGQNYRLFLPEGHDPETPTSLVIYCHGSGGDETQLKTYFPPLGPALSGAGYLVAESNLHGDAWGNDAAQADIIALVNAIKADHAIANVLFYGASMGGLLTELTIQNSDANIAGVPIAGAAFNCPVLNLADTHANASYSAAIENAFGGNAGYVAALATHNPLDIAQGNANSFRNRRLRFYLSSDDTAIPPANNTSAILPLVSAPEKGVVTVVGGHTPPATVDAARLADLVSFYARCRSSSDFTTPELGAPTLATNGLTLSVPFSESVTGSNGFVMKVAGATRAATVAGSGAARTLTLSSAVYAGQVVTLNYGPGNIADAAGNALAAVVGRAVTNNSTVPVPQEPPVEEEPSVEGTVDITIQAHGEARADLKYRLTMDAPAPVILGGRIESVRTYFAETDSIGEATFEGVYTSSMLRAAKRIDTYSLTDPVSGAVVRLRIPDGGGNVASMIVS